MGVSGGASSTRGRPMPASFSPARLLPDKRALLPGKPFVPSFPSCVTFRPWNKGRWIKAGCDGEKTQTPLQGLLLRCPQPEGRAGLVRPRTGKGESRCSGTPSLDRAGFLVILCVRGWPLPWRTSPPPRRASWGTPLDPASASHFRACEPLSLYFD